MPKNYETPGYQYLIIKNIIKKIMSGSPINNQENMLISLVIKNAIDPFIDLPTERAIQKAKKIYTKLDREEIHFLIDIYHLSLIDLGTELIMDILGEKRHKNSNINPFTGELE